MKLCRMIVHNFRSIKDINITISNYSLFVGKNNSGKSTIVTALRMFYEDVKYLEKIDFPKFTTDDNESWIELHFVTTAEEQEGLKSEYQSDDKVLKVRKYFASEEGLVQTSQSNIYGYENGQLSKNMFYGAKNISQSKLGRLIYIPEISKTDDTLKLSGPSPFREMISFVMKKVISNSASYSTLKTAFEGFNETFKDEATKDGFSLTALVEDINREIETWKIKFGVEINHIMPDDIVKNLLAHHIEDEALGGQRVSVGSYGQGLQRHLIYTLIRLSSKYADKKEAKKKEFSPEYVLILFEEPEAFLHPTQQVNMNNGLRAISQEDEHQVLVTTHSPVFVSKNNHELTSIVKLRKIGAETRAYQITEHCLTKLMDSNIGLYKHFNTLLADGTTPDGLKKKIKSKNLGEDAPDESQKLEEEAFKYFMWLDSERSSLFFAKHVIICEGATEKVFLDYLVNQLWSEFKDSHIYLLDSMGKFNVHRYMNLCGALGISHSVLIDSDNDADIHGIINTFIENNKNQHTTNTYAFDDDIEGFLGIAKPTRKDQKPLNIISKYHEGAIACSKLDELKVIVNTLVS